MKRISFLITAAALVFGLLFASCAKKAETDQSLKKVTDKGVLVLGLDDAFPPMGFRDANNEIVGYDIDLAKEVAKRMGVTLQLQPIDWNAKEQELNTGKIDCIWNGFTITEERAKNLSFTKPYMKNAQVVVVRKDSGFTALSDLNGKNVGVQAGSSAAGAIDGAAGFKASLKGVIEFKDNLTALMDLEIKGVDGVVMDLIVANDNIVRSGKAYAILGDQLAPEDYGIGFRKNDLALTNKVQVTLEEMAKDGTIAAISAKWFGADISTVGK